MRHKPIDSSLFATHRKQLAKALPRGAVAVFNSNDRLPTNADGTMPYHQNSDLFYLTGIYQENTTLIICPDFPDQQWREVLFIDPPNDQLARWSGSRLSKQKAQDISAVQTILWNTEFHNCFHRLMIAENIVSVFLNTNEHHRSEVAIRTKDARFVDWCKTNYPLHCYDRVAPIMARLRTVKQKLEIELLQKACDITEKGFRRSLNFIKPNVMEYEIEAEYLHEFVRQGSRGFAYEPIVASGTDNCVLHYTKNNKQCRGGDLVLLDMGAEYAHYNADLTRTVPVGGTFTKRQKEVYNATLRVMKGAMTLMTQSLHFFDYQKEVEKIMEEELLKLKLLTKKDIRDQSVDNPAFREYFHHGVSHMLGLDVHDVGNLYAPMAVGSVWTVEPGIYIRDEGFGVRLENNVVIRKNSVHDLMRSTPIEADEVETLMNE